MVLCVLANTLWKQDFVYLTQTYRYSARKAYELLDSIGASGRMTHLWILWVDIAMVTAYTSFLIGLNYRLITRITSNCHWITGMTFSILPLFATQLIEVIVVAIVIQNAALRYENLANLASTFTTYKFYFTPVCYGLPIILLSVKIIKNALMHRRNGRDNCEKERDSTL